MLRRSWRWLSTWGRAALGPPLQVRDRALALSRRLRHHLERTLARLGQTRFARSPAALLAWQVCRGMGSGGDAAQTAASVAFYALFALFPMLLGFLAVLGLVLNSPQAQQRFLELAASHLPGSAHLVLPNVEGVVRLRGVLALGAVFGFVGSAGALFTAIGRAVNGAWGIHRSRPFYRSQPLRCGLALAAGGLFLIATWATAVLELLVRGIPNLPGLGWLVALGDAAQLLIPWAASFLVFLLIYRLAPYCKTYWRYVWPGALIAALLLEVGKGMFLWYVRNLAVYDRIYGPLTSAIVLLSWAYMSALILVLGAHVSARWQELRMGSPSP